MQKLVPDELLQQARPCTLLLASVGCGVMQKHGVWCNNCARRLHIVSAADEWGKSGRGPADKMQTTEWESWLFVRMALMPSSFAQIWNRFRFWQISFPVLVQGISWLCPRPDWLSLQENVWPINSPGIFDIMIHVDPPTKPSEYFLRSLGFRTLFPDRMYMLDFSIFSSFRVTSVEEL